MRSSPVPAIVAALQITFMHGFGSQLVELPALKHFACLHHHAEVMTLALQRQARSSSEEAVRLWGSDQSSAHMKSAQGVMDISEWLQQHPG